MADIDDEYLEAEELEDRSTTTPGCSGPFRDAWDCPVHDPRKRAFVCKARTSNTDPPQECDWPHCGCDPYAEKVLAALEEGGWTLVRQGAPKEKA